MRNLTDLAFNQHAIPNRDDLGRMLRYQATAERNLRRAQIALERLQRRRKEGSALPGVTLRLAG